MIIGIILTATCYMIYPFVRVKITNKKYDDKSVKRMALWNSIVVGAVFLFLNSLYLEANGEEFQVSFMPALVYYYINCQVWVSRKKKK